MELMTEKEALETWCPKSVGVSDVDSSDIGVNRHEHDGFGVAWPKECGCLASKCQSWLWAKDGTSGLGGVRKGRCGLLREDDGRATAALEKIAGLLERLAAGGKP